MNCMFTIQSLGTSNAFFEVMLTVDEQRLLHDLVSAAHQQRCCHGWFCILA